ncbi:MAG: DNA recombination protein RmuC [Spirochaetaceae bacterium]|jgi:DNA recombination protein RmuC|nr:DNA recombination protein RmuC [Spirochaetaceae bacterium]
MNLGIIIELAILAIVIIGFIVIILLVSKNRQGSQEHILQKLLEYDKKLDKNEANMHDEFGRNREETNKTAKESREELSATLKTVEEKLSNTLTNFTGLIDNKMKSIQEFLTAGLKFNREELAASLKSFEEKSSLRIETLTKDTKDSLEKNRDIVEKKLNDIQKENGEKLEQMRKTVDEKLQESINRRFNESFELISKRLEEVQKGLGEMQTLASDVGGLKKVLTNVKTRGTFGEVQLESILEQILSAEQYEMQAPVKKNTQERVDAVVKLPGQTDDGTMLLLPIDSKFSVEDYQRLFDAYEAGETKEVLVALRKKFEDSVKNTAKSIAAKYINPPMTTDFAIMFVSSEGIYAEILRNAELFESLRRDFRITVVGPTNLSAFLSSLQIGFRTLAIQKRTSEVWAILGAVKTEFGKFGDVLDSASKQLETVANSITKAGTRTRAIEKKLKDVEKLPEDKTQKLLGDISIDDE